MSPWLKYTLIQLPELVLVAVALVAARAQGWISGYMAAILAAVWLLKEVLLYPLYRRALMEGPSAGAGALVGCRGRAATALAPTGQIRIKGEYWRARLAEDGDVEPGGSVIVEAADGLELTVRPCRDHLMPRREGD